MDDDAFLAAFESGLLPNSAFHHRGHLRLAWLYLHRDGAESGARSAVEAIQRFAAAHGAANLFHQTLTLFWIRLVQHLTEAFPHADRFDDLVAHYPRIADKTLIYHHYSPESLAQPAARRGWLEPDLLPLR